MHVHIIQMCERMSICKCVCACVDIYLYVSMLYMQHDMLATRPDEIDCHELSNFRSCRVATAASRRIPHL